MAKDDFDKLNDSVAQKNSQAQLNEIFTDVKSLLPKYDSLKVEPLLTQNANEVLEIEQYRKLSEEAEKQGNLSQSLAYYRKYSQLEAQFNARIKQQKIDSIELRSQAQRIQLLQQENDLNEIQVDLQNEKLIRQERYRNILLVGAGILFLLAIIFYQLFITKKKAHQQLKVTYNQLNATKSQLEKAEQKITKLLGQQVSGDIAQALISEEVKYEKIRKYVCVMFLDIRNFTPFANSRTPEEIIEYQNDVFGFMIEIIDKHNGVINQFMGDGFMATFGAPISHHNDVENAYNGAKEIVEQVNFRSNEGLIYKTRVGIGLHAGNVVTGNVGTELRKQYSITGTTVITAARIEQLNKKFNSQLLISEDVKNQISKNDLECFEVELKGIEGKTTIYKVA